MAFLFSPFAAFASADSGNSEVAYLLVPEPDSEIIAKKPEIVFQVAPPHAMENIYVLLDGMDMTGIIGTHADGFSFKPVEMLPSGIHTLQIIALTPDGSQVIQEFTFSTRHSKPFEEAYSRNDLSGGYENTLEKPDGSSDTQTSYKLQTNLSNQTVIKKNQWQVGLNTNLRYLNQNLALNSPLEKGVNLANYLLTGSYSGEQFLALTEFGDVQVSETTNTVNLARRGGTFALEYEDIKLKTFIVNSEEVFGFTSGTGISTDMDDHIMGISGEIDLFSDKVRFKTIYAEGGEKGDSYSIYTVGQDSKGSVLGFHLSSGFLENKVNTEAELDFSHYDVDTEDEFSFEDDHAYRLAATGLWENYSLGAMYEYFGSDYQVIGNPYIQNDRQGLAVNFGLARDIHSATVTLSKYNDNVDDDKLYPETDAYQGGINYSFNKYPSLPMALNYQYFDLETSKEPDNFPEMETTTNSISGVINYMRDAWNFGFQAGYSDQNDKTPQNLDTEAYNFSLSSGYLAEYIAISPSASFNRSTYKPTGVDSDTYTGTLDLRGTAWEQKITYECAGTISRMETSDDTMKTDIYNATFRLAYILAPELFGLNNPAAGFMGYFTGTEDHVYDTDTNDFTLLFVFSTTMSLPL